MSKVDEIKATQDPKMIKKFLEENKEEIIAEARDRYPEWMGELLDATKDREFIKEYLQKNEYIVRHTQSRYLGMYGIRYNDVEKKVEFN